MPDEELNEQRLRALEVGHTTLTHQIADIAVQQNDMSERLEAAIERAVERAVNKLFERTQQRAKDGFLKWLWSLLKDFLFRWVFIGFLVLSVAKYAGWPLAATIFDALTGRK